MKLRLTLLAAVAGASALAAASPARACSGVVCFLPAAFSVAEGAVVPANFGELSVFPESTHPRSGRFTLKVWAASDPSTLLISEEVGAAGDQRVTLGSALKPGESYVAEAKTGCHFDWPDQPEVVRRLHFSLSPETIEPPSSLGALRSVRHGPTVVAYGGGAGCFYDLDSDAVDLVLDTNALPEAWRTLIGHYQLIVDGAPFSWPLTVGTDDYGPADTARGFYFTEPGTFRAFTECEASDSSERVGLAPGQRGLAPGVHSVWVEARVPITPARVIESERVEIELSCERAASAADADVVVGGGDRAGLPAEPPPADAGSGDASHVAEDEQQDAAGDAAHTGSNGGCSLRARGSAPGAVSGALVLLLLAAVVRRSVRRDGPRHVRLPAS